METTAENSSIIRRLKPRLVKRSPPTRTEENINQCPKWKQLPKIQVSQLQKH
ncbi:hypothetical protein [Microcoleus anatoxicus]|uniref:hypothetical protein n=1 Tax=Microcoleus anatoxicus TaxID=2705319 RepID=UPI0030C9D2AA